MEQFTIIMLPAVPEIFLAVSGMVLLMAGVFGPGRGSVRLMSNLTLAALIGTLVLIAVVGDANVVAFNGMYATDRFAVFMKVMILAGSFFAVVMSSEYLKNEGITRFEFPILILYATVGMLMMVSANNLLALYLGLELQSLCLYVIAAIHRDSLRSSACCFTACRSYTDLPARCRLTGWRLHWVKARRPVLLSVSSS
jgi:NADH-quinone oxidoreductase subunit N